MFEFAIAKSLPLDFLTGLRGPKDGRPAIRFEARMSGGMRTADASDAEINQKMTLIPGELQQRKTL